MTLPYFHKVSNPPPPLTTMLIGFLPSMYVKFVCVKFLYVKFVRVKFVYVKLCVIATKIR